MACHSEEERLAANLFLKPRRPKNLWFKQAGKIRLDLTQQKNRPCLWKRKILRRPIIICLTIKFVAGLLRMTKLNTWLVPELDAHGLLPGSQMFFGKHSD
jgi:hypothetical protein